MTRLPALLLTGGDSRRMGTDKATILWRGETLAARAARILTSVADPVIEVGRGTTALPVVRESPAGRGPLAAMLAGIAAFAEEPEAVLVLACDMPFVDAPLLELLAGWPSSGSVIPRREERPQYLCARYGRDWIRIAALSGAASFKDVLGAPFTYIDEAEWGASAPANAFDDVDTPTDRARLGDP